MQDRWFNHHAVPFAAGILCRLKQRGLRGACTALMLAAILQLCSCDTPGEHASDAVEHARETGEFSIPWTLPLDPPALAHLRALVRSDSEARALAEEAAREAVPLLSAQPRPLAELNYEGLVNTDPRRVTTVQHLRDMAHVARVLRYWQTSNDARAAAMLRRFILAWTHTYRLTGNDVNENKLFPLLVAYYSLRDCMKPDERVHVDAWVDQLGHLHAHAVAAATRFTNRYSKHLRLLAIAGIILDREEWRAQARDGVLLFVTQSLRPDGTSEDLERRDTLTYHASALTPVIELALLARTNGINVYTWTPGNGASLRASVDYVVPYALGTTTRQEWVHSTVDLDQRRAEAGLEKYRPGRLFDPHDALEVMQLAACFDPGKLAVVRHLTGSAAQRFPAWPLLINAALQRAHGQPRHATNGSAPEVPP